MNRILLIEDHPIILKAMIMMLTSLDCTVDQATTGAEAQLLFQKNEYPLILLDIGLPDINGIELLNLMRQHKNNKKASTPVIITSAHSDEIYKTKALELGIKDFLVKPLSIEDCKSFVKKYVIKGSSDPNKG